MRHGCETDGCGTSFLVDAAARRSGQRPASTPVQRRENKNVAHGHGRCASQGRCRRAALPAGIPRAGRHILLSECARPHRHPQAQCQVRPPALQLQACSRMQPPPSDISPRPRIIAHPGKLKCCGVTMSLLVMATVAPCAHASASPYSSFHPGQVRDRSPAAAPLARRLVGAARDHDTFLER